MSHTRTLARQWLVTHLTNANTMAQNRVYNSKITPWFEQGCPAIGVYTMTERPGDMLVITTPRRRNIILEIAIEAAIIAKDADSFADELDDFCLQIQNVVDRDLGRTVDVVDYASTDIHLDKSSHGIVCIARLTYEAQYEWIEGAIIDPSTLEDLKTIDAKWDMAEPTITGAPGPDGQIDAEDKLVNLNI